MWPEIWHNLFHVDVSIAEKIIRPILIYGFLIIGLRLAGKRELAQLNPFDLVVLLTLSNTVQNAIIGNDNSLLGGVIGAITLLWAANWLVVRFLYSHQNLDRLIEGKPDVLIENGKIKMDRLKSEWITLANLEAAAHRQGFGSLEEVDRAILEPGGGLTFVRRQPDPDEARHTQLIERIEHLQREMAKLTRNID